MSRFTKLLAAVGATMCFAGGVHATGFYGPEVYLDEGGKNVDGSPEFYWNLEVRRLSKDFHPTEKLPVSENAKSKKEEENNDQETDNKPNKDITTESDLKDFDAALNDGHIKPPDPVKAKQQHKDARDALDATFGGKPTPLPAEFDSEFADYH